MAFCSASFIFLIASGEAWKACSITSNVLSRVQLTVEGKRNIPRTGCSTSTMTTWLVESAFFILSGLEGQRYGILCNFAV